MRHYLPFRTLGAIFGIPTATIHLLLHTELRTLVESCHEAHLTLNNWDEIDFLEDWPQAVGIIDCTELPINVWVQQSYSKKKSNYTLKYQVVINITTGSVLNIYGPCPGSYHDSNVYRDSQFWLWLINNNYYLLGDRAYVGLSRMIPPIKRNNPRFSERQRNARNRKLAKTRILVENHFAQLKKWNILYNCYRGNVNFHRNIFWACEILESMRKFY